MIRLVRFAALFFWVAALTATAKTPVTYTETNVLQNISLQLTIYQQGATNSNGKKVSDQVTSYNTKSLIQALGTVTGNNFGNSAKLVQSTIYTNVTILVPSGASSTVLSTNLALTTNSYLIIGGVQRYGTFNDPGIIELDGNAFVANAFGNISSNIISLVTSNVTVQTVAINTNVGFVTTFTPSTDTNGLDTSVLIATQSIQTESVLTNLSTTVGILYGPSDIFFPVGNYFNFSTNDASEVVVETGSGLDTTNTLTVTNLASQTGYSIQTMTINYSMPTGPTNLFLSLEGFVKQALKVDTLYSRGTNKVIEDIFGASANWNVIGSGYAGGTFTTNTTVPGGYLTNANTVAVEGTVNISFLKNLPQ
jgi:hypothetical protein